VTSLSTETLSANIRAVRERIEHAARATDRRADQITLVAVSKTHPPEMIEAAVSCGIAEVGESRVQEGLQKIEQLGSIARWHLVGHLQSNKVSKAVRGFDWIQSIDSPPLAQKLSEAAVRLDRHIVCLLEVNSSGEKSKYGFSPDDLIAAAGQIMPLPGLTLHGLMTIGPLTDDPDQIARAFDLTYELFVAMRREGGENIDTLSMGMSDDYELAIRHGSTMVRVGTALFGPREW
jgi:pyridoxal phosphate enzyme (YggS family)